MEIITPGIRLKGQALDDQKRVKSPREAFKSGATSIVMGRSLIKGNIKNNIQKLIKSFVNNEILNKTIKISRDYYNLVDNDFTSSKEL